jgi:hypothetical protein
VEGHWGFLGFLIALIAILCFNEGEAHLFCNANSYNFPVCYKVVKGAGPDKIMGNEPDLDLLQCFIQAAQELERRIV